MTNRLTWMIGDKKDWKRMEARAAVTHGYPSTTPTGRSCERN
ncbi:hypothetical protein J2S40_001556 [Nocardioides luteus]|nr:hypothetical protein [Nocardioides luteus]